MTSAPNNPPSATAWDRLALVILAAGESRRMGEVKALIELDGRPILQHMLALPLLRDFGDVVVVLGHHAERLQPIVERTPFRWVLNADPDRGRTSSVQTGLGNLSDHIEAAFIQPVDCPLIRPGTYRLLADRRESADVIIPTLGSRGGHPPLIASGLFARILSAGPDDPLRDLFLAHGVDRQTAEVDDPGVLLNIDRPDDLDALAETYRSYRQEN